MKKIITTDQITALLNTIYPTNITASNFDAIKKFFSELPVVAPELPKEVEPAPVA